MSTIAGMWMPGRSRGEVRGAFGNLEEGLEPFRQQPWERHAGADFELGVSLRVLTPEDRHEHPPYVSDDGRFVLVADVRLDGRNALISRLGLSTRVGAPWPDGRLLLAAFERWGEACVEHLVGAFAAVVFDTKEQTLTGLRDHLGRAPLFYSLLPEGGVAVASAVRGLRALPAVGSQLNLAEVARYLVNTDVESAQTQYEGITELPGGHVLRVRGGEHTVRRYWNLPPPHRGDLDERDIDHLLHLLSQAVGDQLRTVHTVGSFLSGGLDSSSVSCLAARALAAQGRTLPTFTHVPAADWQGVDWERRMADERPYVEAVVAQQPGLRPTYVPARPRSLFDDLDRLLDLSGGLTIHGYYNRLWIEDIYQEAAQQGVGVMLEGQAGNTTLSWHGHGVFSETLRRGQWGRFVRELRHAPGPHRHTLPRRALSSVLATWMPYPVHRRIRKMRGAKSSINPFIRRDFLQVHGQREDALAERRHALYPDAARRAFILRFAGRAAATLRAWETMYGVTTIDPTADWRLVRYSLSLPATAFMRDGLDRWPLRQATRDLLPEKVRMNRKRGLQLAGWGPYFDADVPRFRERLVRWQADPLVNEIIDVQALERALQAWPETDAGDIAAYEGYRVHFVKAMLVGELLSLSR